MRSPAIPNESANVSRLQQFAAALFALTVFSLGFMKPSFRLFGVILTPTDILFPIVSISFAALIAIGARTIKNDPIYKFLALFVGAMAVSTIFSVDTGRSAIQLVGEVYLTGLCVLTINFIASEKDKRFVVMAWLAGSIIPVVVGLAALIVFYADSDNSYLNLVTSHYGAVPVGNYPRLSSTFVSASMFCNYLNVTFFMLVLAKENRWLSSKTFAAGAIATIICAVFTISSGLGAVILSVGFYFLYKIRRNHRTVGHILFAASAAAAIAIFSLSFIEIAGLPEDYVVSSNSLHPSPRVFLWRDAVQTFLAHPLVGKGVGAPAANVLYENAEGTTSLLTDAHNVFLNVAAEAGIFGIAALLALCVYIVRTITGKLNDVQVRGDQLWLVTAFAAAFLLQGLTSSFDDARHLWVLVGLLAANRCLESNKEPVK